MSEKAAPAIRQDHAQNEKANGTSALAARKPCGSSSFFRRHFKTAGLGSRGLRKKEDGTGRRLGRTEIINPPEFVMAIRPKHGTFYDGTAALNSKAAIGDLAGSSQDISGAAIVDPKKLSNLQEFPKSFWTEYLTTDQSISPEIIRGISAQ